MPTITDNTGTQSLLDVGGRVWIKTSYPTYENYRTDGFFVGQTTRGFWVLKTEGSRRAQVFRNARAAMSAAAVEVAA